MNAYRAAMIGLPVSKIWTGHGSALFIEFGIVAPTIRRDGTPGNGDGEMGLGIEWSWRVEDASTILCGSESEKADWLQVFDRLLGQSVVAVDFVGRLPELAISFSGNLHLSSFMPTDGQPEWSLFDRRNNQVRWLHVEDGRFTEDTSRRPESG
jgi:hypothetical protein